MKFKNLLIIGIIFIVILQAVIIFGQEINNENSGEGVITSTNQDGTIGHMLKKNSNANVIELEDGTKFENLLPYGGATGSVTPSYILVDKEGKIIEADLTTNSKGGNYNINGLNFSVPGNSRIYYSEKTGFVFPKGTKIIIPDTENLAGPVKIKSQKTGEEIFLSDRYNNEISLDGELSIQKNGYFIGSGKAIFNDKLISVKKPNEKILIAAPDADMSSYNGNWIKQTANKLEIKSSETGEVNIEFLEGNKIIDVKNSGLKVNIKNGDAIEILKREGKPALVAHKSSETGSSIIANGASVFELNKNGIYAQKQKNSENSNIKTNSGISLEIKSDSEKLQIKENENTLKINEQGETTITDDKTGEPIVSQNVEQPAKIENAPYSKLERDSGEHKDFVIEKLLQTAQDSGFTPEQVSEHVKSVLENQLQRELEKRDLEKLNEVYSTIHDYNPIHQYTSEQGSEWIKDIYQNSEEFGAEILDDIPNLVEVTIPGYFETEHVDKLIKEYSKVIGDLKEQNKLTKNKYNDLQKIVIGANTEKQLNMLKKREIPADTAIKFITSYIQLLGENYLTDEDTRKLAEKTDMDEGKLIKIHYKVCKEADISVLKCTALLNDLRKA